MSSGWGHALQSAVTGYMRGQRIVEDQDEAEYRKRRREREERELAEADALKTDLKRSQQAAQIQQGAGGMVKPDSMDNRDVGLAENADLPNGGLMKGGYSVAGRAYEDQAAAQTAADSYNGADAQAQRASQVYRQHGQIDKSMALEASRRSAEASEMQLADARWKRDLGAAMRGGHDGLAKFATGSETGPMAGLNVQAVPSADGKTVTYATLDKEGKATPIAGLPTFSNDQNGLIQAAYMLDRTITPQQRMEHFNQQQDRERQQANSDRSYALAVSADERAGRAEGRSEAAEGRSAALGAVQLGAAKLALDDAKNNAKIPPGVKMQAEGLRKEQDTINTAIVKAQAEGSWDVNSPGAKQLLTRQAAISLKLNNMLSPYIKDGGGAAPDPLGIRETKGAGGGGKPTTPSNEQRDEFLSTKVKAPTSYKDPAWDAIEADVSKLTGVPQEVMRVIRTVGERSNDNQVSSAGAKKTTQFTEDSRRLFKKKYGVDAYSDNAREQVLAQALHLKESFDRTGSWDKAMAGYNGGPTAEKGTNKTAENKAYAARTSAALKASSATPELRRAGEARAAIASNFDAAKQSVAAWATRPERPTEPIDMSGLKGGSTPARAPASVAAQMRGEDPMQSLYAKQVAEMEQGIRQSLSPDVAEWKRRQDERAAAAEEKATAS